MISLRRAGGRSFTERDQRRVWSTFSPKTQVALLGGALGVLEFLNEIRLGPGASVAPHTGYEGEIVSYVREGVLACSKSRGRSVVTHAGEFQRMSVRRGMGYGEKNSTRTGPAHVLQIGLRLSETGPDRAPEHERFTAAQRRNALCVVASPDGRQGSLRIDQDALIFSSILDLGHHLVHELCEGRGAWLHLVHGRGTLGEDELTTGDGAGITAARAVSFTAQEETEILVVDVGEELPTPQENSCVR